MTEHAEYTVRVHYEDDDSVWADVIELPGCFASGGNLDELMEALREAIELYLSEGPHKDKKVEIQSVHKVERPMQVGEMRVLVPA